MPTFFAAGATRSASCTAMDASASTSEDARAAAIASVAGCAPSSSVKRQKCAGFSSARNSLVSSSGKSAVLGQLAERFADTLRALTPCGASSRIAADDEIHAMARMLSAELGAKIGRSRMSATRGNKVSRVRFSHTFCEIRLNGEI